MPDAIIYRAEKGDLASLSEAPRCCPPSVALWNRLEVREEATAPLGGPDPLTYLSVIDVRFYEDDHKTIREDTVDDVNERLAYGIGCFLMLGVARPWHAPRDTQERHWLQLNGLALDNGPTGDDP
jgi:hypothetical protein